MNKIFIIFFGVSLTAFGMEYTSFKKHTIKHAKVLQSQALSKRVTQEKNNILLRTANPTLGLELSKFNPQRGSNAYEYSAMASQKIRTGSYYHGIEQKANAQMLLTSAYVNEGKAGFFKMLETLYTEYVYQSKLLALLKEEYQLSKKVTHMVKERYQSGSETKVAYLQAKTDSMRLKTKIYSTKQEVSNRHYQLLASSGLTKKVHLETKFIYSPSKQVGISTKSHPKKQILQAKKKMLESQLNISNTMIDAYELYAGIENEPEQSVVKVGVSLPLPLFNDKSEEKALARLQMEQLTLDNEQFQINVKSQKHMIKASIKELSNQYHSFKTLKREQQKLSTLLQEGYKLAQGSLFVMMNAKNKLIQTRKSLLLTQKEINVQKITYRHLQGVYND
jgi:outer membrane protein TolC